MFNSNLLKIMPRLEADGAGSGGAGAAAAGASRGDGQNNGQTPQNNNGQTYSKEDLDRISAQGESRGQAALLKSLGFEDEKSAKAFLEQARKDQESKKTDLEKAQETLKKEQSAKAELEDKVTALERNLAVIAAGVPAEKAGDIALLAASKMTDGKSFDVGLEEIKKTYPQLFESTNNDTGTGGTPPRGGTGSANGQLGKRLAERIKKSNNSKQNTYFQD